MLHLHFKATQRSHGSRACNSSLFHISVALKVKIRGNARALPELFYYAMSWLNAIFSAQEFRLEEFVPSMDFLHDSQRYKSDSSMISYHRFLFVFKSPTVDTNASPR